MMVEPTGSGVSYVLLSPGVSIGASISVASVA